MSSANKPTEGSVGTTDLPRKATSLKTEKNMAQRHSSKIQDTKINSVSLPWSLNTEYILSASLTRKHGSFLRISF